MANPRIVSSTRKVFLADSNLIIESQTIEWYVSILSLKYFNEYSKHVAKVAL